MIVPKGSQVGLQHTDKGQVTIEDIDGSGGRAEGYRDHFRWDIGLSLRDWRYVVRIANIDKSELNKDITGNSADLADLMVQATELIPNMTVGRAAFYMARDVRSMLRRQITASVANSTLSMENIAVVVLRLLMKSQFVASILSPLMKLGSYKEVLI